MNFPVNWGHAMLLKGKYPKAPLHILEAMDTHVLELNTLGQAAPYQLRRYLGQNHLSTMGDRPETGTMVYNCTVIVMLP